HRTEVNGVYLYTASDSPAHRRQFLMRRTAQSVPVVADVSALQVSPDELKTAILLFYSLLDEQQRRLYAGLESIRLGRGGDTLIADFLALGIPIRSHVAVSSCSIVMSLLAAHAEAVAAEHLRKKNARNNCMSGGLAGRRYS